MEQVTVSRAMSCLRTLIDRLAEEGTIVLTESQQPVAILKSYDLHLSDEKLIKLSGNPDLLKELMEKADRYERGEEPSVRFRDIYPLEK